MTIRPAKSEDVPILSALIAASVRGLQQHDYTVEQLEGALESVYGVDTQLIADGTYFVVEVEDDSQSAVQLERLIVGCGGWSKRRTLYGGDNWQGREDALLDPNIDAAKIRAFFVHPDWARRGIGSAILEACEHAAVTAGFKRLEMGATLTGVPFYQAKGYTALESHTVPLANGETLTIVRMEKRLPDALLPASD